MCEWSMKLSDRSAPKTQRGQMNGGEALAHDEKMLMKLKNATFQNSGTDYMMSWWSDVRFHDGHKICSSIQRSIRFFVCNNLNVHFVYV